MTTRGQPSDERTGEAFAPGHVTGVFMPAQSGRDPRGRGSVGAGLVLELGVRARAVYRPGATRTVRVRSRSPRPLPITTDVADRLLGHRTGALSVELVHQLPIGQGFGMSAAGALATALAVGGALGLPEQRCDDVAHLADLFGGGGLGGVAAILGGGLEIRRRPGVPPRGQIDHRPFRPPILVGVVGPRISSPARLADPEFLDRVEQAARPCLKRLAADPRRFLRESETFTDSLGLVTPALRHLLDGVRATGARAAQAMFGTSFFAVPSSAAARVRMLKFLAKREIRAVEVRASGAGARRIAPYPA